MDLRNYLKQQIKKGETNWESRSALIRAAGKNVNGHTNRVLKEYENKFHFGSIIEIKNKEIKKYFDNQPKNSLISVEGAVKIINKNLPKNITRMPKGKVSTTLIYSRLEDTNFNKNNLKGQTLDNQVSKFGSYDVMITKELENKILDLKEPGIYLTIEKTQRRGSKILRLRTSEEYGNLNTSFPPNEDSIKIIKKMINEQKY